jgi:hypothetical protein
VDDGIRVHRPKTPLEVVRRRGAVLDKQRGECRENSIGCWI